MPVLSISISVKSKCCVCLSVALPVRKIFAQGYFKIEDSFCFSLHDPTI